MSKQVIIFHYVLTDKSGATIDSSRGAEPLAFLEGTGQIIPGLEKILVAMKKGDKQEVKVPSAAASGSSHQAPIYYRVVTVIDIAEKEVTLDQTIRSPAKT